MTSRPLWLSSLASALLLGVSLHAGAQESQPACPVDAPDPRHRAVRSAPKAPQDARAPTYISADQLRAIQGGLSEFIGNVELDRGEEHIRAGSLRYDKPSDTIDAQGAVSFGAGDGSRFETDALHMTLDTKTGYIGQSNYQIGGNRGRGDAGRIDFSGPNVTTLTDVRYTTCPVGQNDWFLHINHLELDREEDIGTARHVWADFLGVPIFYLPYLSFPISNERRSGFLLPRFGYDEKQGIILAAPYYLNLAPNYDATLTPQWMSHHGLMIQGEFRYLTQTSRGRLLLEAVPNEKMTGEDRGAGSYRHQQTFTPYWSGNVDFRRVSDDNYLNDFGNQLGVTSQTHLPQMAEAIYRDPTWNFAARLSTFQTIDPAIPATAEPYARLPQLTLNATPINLAGPARLYFDAEWVRFEHNLNVSGIRTTAAPAVSLPLIAPWGFLTPRLGAQHIAYQLDRDINDTPSTTVSTFSLDSGLIFERELKAGGRGFTQTLEPRLFYLHVPQRDQDALPLFDTALADFSFAGLFRENRFSGGDRIGDANQVTAAVTTRFYDDNDGVERLRFSLGQIFYLEDRMVNLPAGIDTRADSDVAAEFAAWLVGNWHLRGSAQWNEEISRNDKSSFYAQYQPSRERIISVGHRFVRNELTQLDTAAEWPLAERWRLRARSIYSLKDDRNVESSVGAEYRACCWALRIFARRHWREIYDELGVIQEARQVNGIQAQIELSGLGRLGRVPDSPLNEGLFFRSAQSQSTLEHAILGH